MTATPDPETPPASPSEAQVRARVIADLAVEFADASGPVLIVEEFGLGRGAARADIAVLTADVIMGVEIKSAADTLTRLPAQARWYSRICDRVALAGDPHHVEVAARTLPDWWRLVTVGEQTTTTIRAGGVNPSPDPESVASLLWIPELKTAIADAGQAGGTAGLERTDMIRVLALAAGDGLGALVRRRLMDRRWIATADALGPVQFVRLPTPTKRVARRARTQNRSARARQKRGL